MSDPTRDQLRQYMTDVIGDDVIAWRSLGVTTVQGLPSMLGTTGDRVHSARAFPPTRR